MIPVSPENCSLCMGKSYWGRIGVHEVLSANHLFNPSLPYMDMYEAGLHHIKAGIVDETSLNDEVSAWR